MSKLNFGIMPGDIYRHYKGGKYKVITLANHSETQEPMVVYQSLSFGSTHVRPLEMWDEEVEVDFDYGIQHGGVQKMKVKRFEKIGF